MQNPEAKRDGTDSGCDVEGPSGDARQPIFVLVDRTPVAVSPAFQAGDIIFRRCPALFGESNVEEVEDIFCPTCPDRI